MVQVELPKLVVYDNISGYFFHNNRKLKYHFYLYKVYDI